PRRCARGRAHSFLCPDAAPGDGRTPFSAPTLRPGTGALRFRLAVLLELGTVRRKSMKNPVSIFLVALVLLSETQDDKAASTQPVTWVFLNTGASRDKTKSMAPEAVSQMQAQHVGNFGTQLNLGKLFAAGPLGDNGFI